jgi:hypothetical protein
VLVALRCLAKGAWDETGIDALTVGLEIGSVKVSFEVSTPDAPAKHNR